MRTRLSLIVVGFLSLSACTSWRSEPETLQPPVVTAQMPLKDALAAGINFGEKTLLGVKNLIKHRHEADQAEALLFEDILAQKSSWKAPQLINAVHLYQSTGGKRAPALFEELVRADNAFLHQVAWHLAAALPSPAMADKVETKLTEAIAQNEISDLFWPKMAEAVAQNHLVQSYTVVRQGLYESNNVAFVRAMIDLNPRRASYDFMDYLARAPLEELRQLSMTSVDVLSCMAILEHYNNTEYRVTVNHPQFEHLFYYAISRNNALAEMARQVLEGYLPHRSAHLALQLSRLPTWVQIAFVEGTRRQMTPRFSVFLTELKETTSQREVIEEINNVVR